MSATNDRGSTDVRSVYLARLGLVDTEAQKLIISFSIFLQTGSTKSFVTAIVTGLIIFGAMMAVFGLWPFLCRQPSQLAPSRPLQPASQPAARARG